MLHLVLSTLFLPLKGWTVDLVDSIKFNTNLKIVVVDNFTLKKGLITPNFKKRADNIKNYYKFDRLGGMYYTLLTLLYFTLFIKKASSEPIVYPPILQDTTV